jgi:hypothetical protein
MAAVGMAQGAIQRHGYRGGLDVSDFHKDSSWTSIRINVQE